MHQHNHHYPNHPKALHTHWLHCSFSDLPSNRSRRYTSLIFSIRYSQSNHHKWDSHITRSKSSYSLIDPQPLPCIPVCGDEFRALALHPHPTFTAPLVGSAFKVRLEVCGGAFLWKQSTCLGCWCLATLSLEVSTTGVTQGNLRLILSPNFADSHQTQMQ